MSWIWVQETCPDRQAEAFLTLPHTLHLTGFLFVCLSLLDHLLLCLSSPLCCVFST